MTQAIFWLGFSVKGTIVKCAEELVASGFGRDKWDAALKEAGLSPGILILATTDVDDAVFIKLLSALCRILNLSAHELGDAFGDYWVNTYSQKIYGEFYRESPDAKSLLLRMDEIHAIMTSTMKNARPPRFRYEWKSDKALIMHYDSRRGLVDLLAGLIKGVGRFYREKLVVKVLDPSRVEITFHGLM